MRKSLLCISLLSGFVLLTTPVPAQQPDKFAYAMTDVQQQNGNWIHLRILNLETGIFSGSLLNGIAEKQIAFDAFTKKQITDFGVNKMGFSEQPAFNSGVAAIAYDNKHARIYFTPMYIDQLRYYDLKSQQVYYVTVPFSGKSVKSPDQGNNITRMTFASDGNGYALTNDGTQLLRFSTNKKTEISDLGTLVDDPANKEVSIHNSCTSFGGDMIADDDGNLYLLTARNHVFKVNIESRVATHLGVISGLPNGFTVNGAAVNENNQVIVGSALESASLFVVDPKSWKATPLKMDGTVWHTSDLANGNLLVSGNKPPITQVELISRNIPANSGDSKISIFPNPVTNNQFTIQFNDLPAGSYTILVTDVTGRQLIQQFVNVGGEKQVQVVKLPASSAGGVYLVKVSAPDNKSVYNTKIVVQ
ncbi:MAG: T9SS type A sorting domain-containing protein [Chitinophagaceae bacterium]